MSIRLHRNLIADPARQCIGKKPHRTRADAMVEQRHTDDETISAYRCPHCNKWHIGHAVGRMAKAQHQGVRR